MDSYIKLNILLVCLLLSIVGFAQEETNIIEGESTKFKSFMASNLPEGKRLVTRYGYYFLKVEKNKKEGRYTLYHYGKDLDLINSKEIIITYNLEQRKILHFTLMKDKILVFESLIKTNKKSKSIRMSTFDPLSFEKIGEPKIVFESKYKGIWKFANRFHFSRSPNSKYLLICESNYQSTKDREIGIAILNEDNDNIQLEKISVHKKRFLIIQNALISDSGEVFILQKRCWHVDPINKTYSNFDFDYRDIWYHGLRKIEYYFHRISPKNRSITKLDLNENIKEVHMNFDINQNPFFMGFNFYKNYKGVVLIKTDGANFDEKNFSYKYFNYTTNKEFSSLLKSKLKQNTLRIKKTLQKPNGNFVIIGEEGHVSNYSKSNLKNIRYYNTNLIITELHEDDGEEWSHLITKTNRTSYSRPADFFLFDSKDDFYIITQDRSSKQPLNLTHITAKGNINTSSIFDKNYSSIYKLNIKISDEEFLILLNSKKNDLEFVKFKIEE